LSLRAEWGSRTLSAAAALALAVFAGDLARSAAGALKRPELARQILAPQEEGCVARSDACELVRALRSMQAGRFYMNGDMNGELDPELYQRVVELAYPERIARGAAVTIDLCRRGPAAPRAPLRIADVRHPDDRDADFCVVDRR
jgi:hypothetical protein